MREFVYYQELGLPLFGKNHYGHKLLPIVFVHKVLVHCRWCIPLCSCGTCMSL